MDVWTQQFTIHTVTSSYQVRCGAVVQIRRVGAAGGPDTAFPAGQWVDIESFHIGWGDLPEVRFGDGQLRMLAAVTGIEPDHQQPAHVGRTCP